MFNKPPSEKAGIGYSGYYNGIFFRSLMELSFLVHFNNNDAKSAENLYSIPYVDNGKKKTYRPDYVVENKVYEVKPKKLIQFNSRKIDAAKLYFSKINIEYVVFTEDDFHYLSINEVKKILRENKASLININRFITKYGNIDEN
jgi:hypothetical protein